MAQEAFCHLAPYSFPVFCSLTHILCIRPTSLWVSHRTHLPVSVPAFSYVLPATWFPISSNLPVKPLQLISLWILSGIICVSHLLAGNSSFKAGSWGEFNKENIYKDADSMWGNHIRQSSKFPEANTMGVTCPSRGEGGVTWTQRQSNGAIP